VVNAKKLPPTLPVDVVNLQVLVPEKEGWAKSEPEPLVDWDSIPILRRALFVLNSLYVTLSAKRIFLHKR
jgi:hypothetical protein